MKALVFGGTGRIGSAVAWDLARYGGAEKVGIVGRSRGFPAEDPAMDRQREGYPPTYLDIADARQTRG